jgi:hypothetical protein
MLQKQLVPDERVTFEVIDPDDETLEAIAILCSKRIANLRGVRIKGKYDLDALNRIKATYDVGVLVDRDSVVLI